MHWRNTTERYGILAQAFHWIIVVLVVVQYALASRAEDLPLGLKKVAVLAQHKSVGITILSIALARLIWRFTGAVPSLPERTPHWQRWSAQVSHVLLYALLISMPITGWMMSSARNFPVSWFGFFTLPDLVGADRALYDVLHEVHETLAKTLFFVALLHALAALKHHFIDKDNVLRRMLPVRLKP